MQPRHTHSEWSFKNKQVQVGNMVTGFEAAKKTEYLKPTTIAGFIFSRLVGDFLIGVQTPIDALVTTHYQAGDKPRFRQSSGQRSSYTQSFERVGNYLRTINDTLESKGIEVVVNKEDDGFYASFYIS